MAINLENSRLSPEAQLRLKKMIEDKDRQNVLLRLSTGQSAKHDHAEQHVPFIPRDTWAALRQQANGDAPRNQIKPGQGAGRKPLPDISNGLRQTNSFKPGS